MVLRFFALFEKLETYKKPLNEFLTSYLSENKDNEKKDVESIFVQTINTIYEKIGADAFRLDKGINKAFFDAISIGVAINLKDSTLNIENILTNYNLLKKNPELRGLVSESTTNTKDLKRRIEIAIEQFKK